jgi:hypothetical protein
MQYPKGGKITTAIVTLIKNSNIPVLKTADKHDITSAFVANG